METVCLSLLSLNPNVLFDLFVQAAFDSGAYIFYFFFCTYRLNSKVSKWIEKNCFCFKYVINVYEVNSFENLLKFIQNL